MAQNTQSFSRNIELVPYDILLIFFYFECIHSTFSFADLLVQAINPYLVILLDLIDQSYEVVFTPEPFLARQKDSL